MCCSSMRGPAPTLSSALPVFDPFPSLFSLYLLRLRFLHALRPFLPSILPSQSLGIMQSPWNKSHLPEQHTPHIHVPHSLSLTPFLMPHAHSPFPIPHFPSPLHISESPFPCPKLCSVRCNHKQCNCFVMYHDIS